MGTITANSLSSTSAAELGRYDTPYWRRTDITGGPFGVTEFNTETYSYNPGTMSWTRAMGISDERVCSLESGTARLYRLLETICKKLDEYLPELTAELKADDEEFEKFMNECM